MKKNILKMATILIVAFAIGAFVGISAPTEVLADDCGACGEGLCIKILPPGGGCEIFRMQEWTHSSQNCVCCGTLIRTCCGPCP